MAIEKQLGPETKFSIAVKSGDVRLALDYGGAQMKGGAFIECTADQLCDALASAIPGNSATEQGAIGIVRMALKNVNV